MRSYEPSTPGVVFGIAAVVMTAVTIGALVVAPAKFDSYREPGKLTMSKVIVPASPKTMADSVNANFAPGLSSATTLRPGGTPGHSRKS